MEELLKRLVEDRQRVWHETKALIDRANDEERDLDGQEKEQYGRMNSELDDLDERIEAMNDRLEADRAADEARAVAEKYIRPDQDDVPEPTRDPINDWARGQGARAIEGSVFDGLVRDRPFRDGPPQVRNVLTGGRGTATTDTFGTSFRQQLYEHLIENSAILQTNVEVLNTSTGEDLIMPKTVTHTSGSIVAEGGTILADDPTYGQATLSTYKYGRLVQVSSELLQDTAVDLTGYLARSFGQALANGFGAHLVTGTGSSQPTGILEGASVGVAGATGISGIPTADELMSLYFAVIEPHASRGWWVMRRATLGAIRKIKDDNGQYIWQPGLAGSSPNTILDRPYVTDPNVPATATDATSVAFGDFSAYTARMVNNVRFERSDDFAFDQDLATYRVLMRAGGVPLGSNGEWQVYVGGSV